ncbi:non-ribosomal peptide synthetase [Nocardia sp. 348MFTsu5.1]|uniref:non-ribosomal peptide synthetase n=1 Tax=Nocardia sp. 348MFTsu5.1 TaxID=1172185 RepID=UPI000360DE00|nr:non-ribosomal peptide synthetase [Nocardia sp. 348MFTsu5.1]
MKSIVQFRQQVLRTSSAAENVLLAQALAPGNPTFVVGQFLRMSGPLEVDLLVRAIDSTLAVLDVATARFTIDAGGGSMVLGHEAPAAQVVDLSAHRSPETAAQDWARKRQSVAIDPASQPCVRATVLMLDSQTHLLHLAAHHVALDAFGIALLMRKVSAVYEGAEPAAMSLDEVVDDDLRYRSSEQFGTDREFWANEIDGSAAAASPAHPDAGPAAIAASVRTERIMLAPQTVAAMSNPAVAGSTWIEALAAGVAGFVARVTDRDELVLGFPMMARMGSPATRVPTTSVNVVPLRIRTALTCSARDVIESFQQTRTRIAAHSRYRGEDIARTVRSAGSSPIVGPSINIKPFGDRVRFAGLDASVESLARGPVTDLSVTAQRIEATGAVELCIDADAQRYTGVELAAIGARLVEFINRFTAIGSDTRLGQIPVVTAAEAADLQVEGPRVDLDSNTGVLQLIRDAAARTPDAVAITSDERVMRYGELIDEADRLADRLRRRGVGAGDRVALLLPRTPALVVALLATLAAGAAYVPLDPRFPADRLEYMLGHSDPRSILTTTDCAAVLSGHQLERTMVLDAPDAIGSPRRSGVVSRTPDSTAYVIYTSGSTGLPKGVAISDRAMANLVRDMSTRFDFGPQTVMLAVTTISFDIAVLELFSPLISGGSVVLAGNSEIQDPHALARWIDSAGVNVMQATPALWAGLLTVGPALDLRGVVVLVGGEPLPESVAEALGAAARSVWNMYGPTETTVWSTLAKVTSGADITVGRPIANTGAYVLDRGLHPVPVGAIGELYLAGDGVATGYFGQADLTASRFVADPHQQGRRMYRTGDLARWRTDGRLDCLGRTDDQVKVRGFRVELGDIETAVAKVAGVDRCVARVVPTATGDRLVAYIRRSAGAQVDKARIREDLRLTLPEYMIPAAVLAVDAFPQTPNGKLDRKALPAPDFSTMVTSSREPANEVEATLCAVFAQVLGLAQVGVEDDFFGLGGDSIAAVRVVGAAAREGLTVTAAHVFDSRTVAVLADCAAPAAASEPADLPPAVHTRERVLPETAVLTGLSQEELDEFEGEGNLL